MKTSVYLTFYCQLRRLSQASSGTDSFPTAGEGSVRKPLDKHGEQALGIRPAPFKEALTALNKELKKKGQTFVGGGKMHPAEPRTIGRAVLN